LLNKAVVKKHSSIYLKNEQTGLGKTEVGGIKKHGYYFPGILAFVLMPIPK